MKWFNKSDFVILVLALLLFALVMSNLGESLQSKLENKEIDFQGYSTIDVLENIDNQLGEENGKGEAGHDPDVLH